MRQVGLLLMLVASACSPEITSDTYYCGPNGLCPPELACERSSEENFTYNCVLEEAAQEFSCPTLTLDQEPDDDLMSALDVGLLSCGAQKTFTSWGCIGSADDVDHFRFSRDSDCMSRPKVAISLRYPIGAIGLSIELLDSSNSSVASGVSCTRSNTR